MKTKHSILTVSKVIFVLLIMCFLFSCSSDSENDLKNLDKFDRYEVVVIDGCEYIEWETYYSYMNITHKGNCKFCAERAEHARKAK